MVRRTATGATCVALAWMLLAGSAWADERIEKSLSHEESLDEGSHLYVENLLGSITVSPGQAGTALRVEARVIAEAESTEQARDLADSFSFERLGTQDEAAVRVRYPVARNAAFRLPRSEKDGLFTKWVKPVVRKEIVSLRYGDRMVEVGGGKGSAAVAVYVKITLPLGIDLAVHQSVGAIHCRGLRSNLDLEIVQGEAIAEQIYGELRARTGGGELRVWRFNGDSFDAQTGAGAIELNDVRAQRLQLHTGSGAIHGTGITATALLIESESGAVKLDEVESGSFEVRTHSGNVDLGTPLTRTRDGAIESTSGDVTLRVGQFAPFDLLTRSGSGSVKLQDLKIERLSEDGSGTRYRRRNGGTDLRITTGEKGKILVRPM